MIAAVALALAVPQPIASHAAGGFPSYALSTGRAVYAESDARGSQLAARSVGGGPRTVLASFPRGAFVESLAASDERVGFVRLGRRDSREYTGPPDGPFTPIGAPAPLRAFHPAYVRVDGPRQLVGLSSQRDASSLRWIMHEPGLPDRRLALPPNAYVSSLAGDHIVYRASAGTSVVADWRTGAIERRVTDRTDETVVRADGAVAFRRGRGVFVAPAGAQPRRLATVVPAEEATGIAWAGQRIVTASSFGVTVVEPDGRARRLGAASDDIELDLVANAGAVLWAGNDCLAAVDPAAGPADAIGPGPCHRTAVAADNALRSSLLRCLAGPGGVCRIEVRHRGAVRRFRLPIGRARRVRGTGGPHGARIFTVDPGGRRRSVPD